jgi:Ras family protein A
MRTCHVDAARTLTFPRFERPLQGQAVASKIGAKHYMECSSRTGQGVKEVFQVATRAALLVGHKKPRKSGSSKCIVL